MNRGAFSTGIALFASIGLAVACGGDDDAGMTPTANDGGDPRIDGSSSSGGNDGAPPPDAAPAGPKTFLEIGDAINDGSIDSVARDDTHVYISVHAVGEAESRLEKRSLVDGKLDSTFGTNGRIAIQVNSWVTVDAERVYLAGLDWKLRALAKANGAEQWATEPIEMNATRGIAVDPTGVYVIGASWSSGFGGWVARKYVLATGAEIPEFAPSDFPSVYQGTDATQIIVRPAANEVVVGGRVVEGSGPNSNTYFAVHLLDAANGATKWSKKYDASIYRDELFHLVASDFSVFALGASQAVPQLTKFTLADGATPAGYPLTSLRGAPRKIAVDATSLYLAGPGGFDKRTAATGVVEGFGGPDGGLATSNGFEIVDVFGMWIDGATIFTVGSGRAGTDAGSTPPQLFVERRSSVTGAL